MAAILPGGGGTYFDIGANVGFTSFGFLPRVPLPETSFHLFEANPRCCELLRLSATDQPDADILVNHGCVTDVSGTSRLVLEPGDSQLGFIGDGGVEVPNLVLDEYIAGVGISRVDLMKIDIEGWEPFALRGAHAALSSGVIRLILTEVSSEALEGPGFTPATYLAMLREHGYDLFWWREEDFAPGGFAAGLPPLTLSTGTGRLRVARVENYPVEVMTDVLAVHPAALSDGVRVIPSVHLGSAHEVSEV
jgi:FkbM family methyltransferase